MNKYLFLLGFLFAAPSFAQNSQKESDWTFKAKMAWAAIKQIPTFIIESKVPLPVHGNYCGPNHGDANYLVEPIDEIDRACMRHDQCFDTNVGGRYLSCGCDAQLVSDLLEVISKSESADYSFGLASAIGVYFTKSECKCYKEDGSFSLLDSPGIFDKWTCVL